MADRHDQTEKQDRLRKAGTLNRTPVNVIDPMFVAGDFFDARDLLQVRYEMVRLVRIGQATLAQAAARFGVSRPTCFRMVKAFDSAGLQGLIPAPRGPRGPHKITPQMLRFVDDYKARHGRVGARRLVPLIEAEFGVRVHPRGLEKALERIQKNRGKLGHDARRRFRHLRDLAPAVAVGRGQQCYRRVALPRPARRSGHRRARVHPHPCAAAARPGHLDGAAGRR